MVASVLEKLGYEYRQYFRGEKALESLLAAEEIFQQEVDRNWNWIVKQEELSALLSGPPN